MVAKYNLELTADLIPRIVKEKEYDYTVKYLTDPKRVEELVNACLNLRYQCEERVILICCDTRLSPVAIFEVAHGTVDQCMVTAREIIQRVLMAGATGFIMVHNHPTQDVSPSEYDRQFAEQLESISVLMNLKLMDFIIIGDGYYSFREHEMLRW